MRSPKRSKYSRAYSWKISFIFMVVSFHHGVDDAIGMFMPLGGEMEIDHGGVEAIVAEVLLDAADVNAGFQEMSSIAVAQGMDGDAFGEFKLFKDSSQSPLN